MKKLLFDKLIIPVVKTIYTIMNRLGFLVFLLFPFFIVYESIKTVINTEDYLAALPLVVFINAVIFLVSWGLLILLYGDKK